MILSPEARVMVRFMVAAGVMGMRNVADGRRVG